MEPPYLFKATGFWGLSLSGFNSTPPSFDKIAVLLQPTLIQLQ